MDRILFTNFHPYDGGGHATYLSALIDCLRHQTEFELHAAVPQTSKTYRIAIDAGIPVYPIEFPGKIRELWSIVKHTFKLRSLLKRRSFRVIHCNGSPDHRLVIYALWFLPSHQRPNIVLTKHNTLPVANTWLNKLRYTRYCDHIIVVCRHLGDQFTEIRGSDAQYSVIPNGVDLNRYAPQADPTTHLPTRRELGLPQHAIVFVSCAGTATHKGWHILANAIARQPAHIRAQLCCCVLGTEPSTPKKQAVLLEPDMPELVFPGHQEDVRPFLWQSDIGFVLSISIETISFACREMMASGLPMLVSDYGCLADNVNDQCGWVVPPNSTAELEQLIPHIVQADLDHMAGAAREMAVAEFSQEKMGLAQIKVYREVRSRNEVIQLKTWND